MPKPLETAVRARRATTTGAGRAAPVLERGSARSLHEQIFDRLHRELRQSLRPGDQVPTEEDLTREYGVSRSTVRKALERLVAEGILIRRQGKGTFLAQPVPHIVHAIDRVAPFVETFKQLGGDIRVEVSQFAWGDGADLPAELAEWPRPVLSFEWRYVSRGVAHALTRTRLPNGLGRRLTQDDVTRYPIYDLLQNKLKIKLEHSKLLVSCRPPTALEAASLQLSQGAYVLVLDRISGDENGNPVEATTHVLRPDVYQLSVELDDLRVRRKS